MRIGIDARLAYQTGVGRYTRNLVKNLAEIDNKNEYVLFIRKEDEPDVKKWKMENAMPVGRQGKWKIVSVDLPWHSLEEQVKLPSILNKENLDLVHFPYFSVPIFYSKPFVVTIHDLILHHFPTGKASTLPFPIYWAKIAAYKFAISRAVKKANKVIAVSNSTKDEIVDHLNIKPEKVVVTYEAVGTAFREKRQASSLTTTKFSTLNANRYFLFVGNVYPHKNAETLIEAHNIFVRQLADPNISLVFVGKEDYFYRRLKQKVKSNKSIEFLHNVSDENLSWLYQNAQAVVCPALMEGFGLPALEAMTNKCLVIASDISALREVCKGNAIYFDPKNPNELVEKMKGVLGNKNKYKDKIENGFKRSQEFSWRKMSEETLKIYEESIG